MKPPFIPTHIIENHILTRLPVKSLLRFRCVGKSWLTLFADPRFIKQHLHQVESEPSSESHQGVLFSHRQKLCCLIMDRNHGSEELSFPLCCSSLPADWTNSCHGLILMRFIKNYGRSEFVLCNLASRTHSFISHPDLYSGMMFTMQIYSYGLGYDSRLDDYKVVMIYQCYDDPNNRVFIYSRNADAWKDLGEIWSFSASSDHALYLNGLLYWLVRTDDEEYENAVVYFDWAHEVFKEVRVPFPMDVQVDTMCNLTAWRGCLCLWIRCEFDTKIWVLQDQAWGLIRSIPCQRFRDSYPKFLCFTNEGENCLFKSDTGCIAKYNCRENKWELLMATWSELHYYTKWDTRNRMIEVLESRGRGAVTFRGSLVSPSLDGTARDSNHDYFLLSLDYGGSYYDSYASPKSSVEGYKTDDMGTDEEQRLWPNSMDQKDARAIKRWKDRKAQKRRMEVLELSKKKRVQVQKKRIKLEKKRKETKVKSSKRDIDQIVEEYLSERSHS